MRVSSNKVQENANIPEADSEGEQSEKSDTTSSDDSGDDSSIDAALNGEDDTEQ